ncbi:MAG: hypothetical protein E7351_00845 [Clostridiales bacterium]|nr:hypothetical protein [Clostridiales bacterium]
MNFEKGKDDKSCCVRFSHEICCYPSYYNEDDKYDNKKEEHCDCRRRDDKRDCKDHRDYDCDEKDYGKYCGKNYCDYKNDFDRDYNEKKSCCRDDDEKKENKCTSNRCRRNCCCWPRFFC